MITDTLSAKVPTPQEVRAQAEIERLDREIALQDGRIEALSASISRRTETVNPNAVEGLLWGVGGLVLPLVGQGIVRDMAKAAAPRVAEKVIDRAMPGGGQK